MKGRCFFSYCGEWFGNGETGAACRVGGEQAIPEEEQLAGWCYPMHDGAWGLCLEHGDVPSGGVCDPAVARCRGEGCHNCGPGSVCIDGRCAQVCDPRSLLSDTGPACPSDQGCRDRSEVHVFDDGLGVGTWGTCELGDACLIVGEATCPPTDEGQAQGCVPTNPVRATGFCDPSGDGDLAVGAACSADAPPGDAHECTSGSVCVTSSTSSRCERLCDLEESRQPCPGSSDCAPVSWTVEPSIKTQDWGTCR
jgi:hypothetical protein